MCRTSLREFVLLFFSPELQGTEITDHNKHVTNKVCTNIDSLHAAFCGLCSLSPLSMSSTMLAGWVPG